VEGGSGANDHRDSTRGLAMSHAREREQAQMNPLSSAIAAADRFIAASDDSPRERRDRNDRSGERADREKRTDGEKGARSDDDERDRATRRERDRAQRDSDREREDERAAPSASAGSSGGAGAGSMAIAAIDDVLSISPQSALSLQRQLRDWLQVLQIDNVRQLLTLVQKRLLAQLARLQDEESRDAATDTARRRRSRAEARMRVSAASADSAAIAQPLPPLSREHLHDMEELMLSQIKAILTALHRRSVSLEQRYNQMAIIDAHSNRVRVETEFRKRFKAA
jgi:hypothetical protein